MSTSASGALQESKLGVLAASSHRENPDGIRDSGRCITVVTGVSATPVRGAVDTSEQAGARPVRQTSITEAVIWQHHGMLPELARRLCGNQADAHDLVQDACERALRVTATDVPENPRAWLITLMSNLFFSQYRQQRRQPRMVPLAAAHDGILAPDPEVEPAWASISPAQVEAALSQLDQRFRQVYELYYMSNASYEEIAAILRISRNTVGTRLARARQKIRALLHAQLSDCGASHHRDCDCGV